TIPDVLEQVGAQNALELLPCEPLEESVVREIADEVDSGCGLDVAVDDAHAAFAQGSEDLGVDPGLMLRDEDARRAADVEHGRKLRRIDLPDPTTEPLRFRRK